MGKKVEPAGNGAESGGGTEGPFSAPLAAAIRALLVTLGLAARPGRFPSDSGKTRSRCAGSGLCPRFGPSSPARLSSRFYSSSMVSSSTLSAGFSAMLTA